MFARTRHVPACLRCLANNLLPLCRKPLQVRCVDKTTGDMMVRYTMAAQSSVDLLRQLLTSCRAFAAATPLGSGGDTEADGGECGGGGGRYMCEFMFVR